MNLDISIAIASILCFSQTSAYAADANRGRALYEIRCIQCHDVSVHSRNNRVAKTYDEVRNWTKRWDTTLGGLWDKDDIEDVSAYLNGRYYQYP